MQYTTQTTSKQWTTPSGTEINLTVTVDGYDYDYKRTYDMIVNGKAVDGSTVELLDTNIIAFYVGNRKFGAKLDDDFAQGIRDMVATAKAEIAPRIAEANEYEDAMRRMS